MNQIIFGQFFQHKKKKNQAVLLFLFIFYKLFLYGSIKINNRVDEIWRNLIEKII